MNINNHVSVQSQKRSCYNTVIKKYNVKASEYPGNGEIAILRDAVIKLEKQCEWQAAYHAKIDLAYEIQKRDKWMKKNVNN